VAGFQSGEGGGGGGGGGGGYGGGRDESRHTWKDYGILNSWIGGESGPDPWERLSVVREILGDLGCSADSVTQTWQRGTSLQKSALKLLAKDILIHRKRDPAQRRWFRENPGRLARIEQLLGTAGGVCSIIGSEEQHPAKERAGARRAERRLEKLSRRSLPPDPAQPRDLPDLPDPGTLPTGEPEPSWLRLLRVAADQWRIYQEQRAARETERAQRRVFRMSLADTVGNVIGGLGESLPTLLPQLVQMRAADQAAKMQLKLARLSPYGAGTAGALGGALGALLGEEPGTLEEGGIFERLGLEGDAERTATLWRRTMSGFAPVRTITARHPTSGGLSTWVNMGRPMLYTGDLAACKRVNKIAARTARAARKRGICRTTKRRRA
jgi:hypothetical protein